MVWPIFMAALEVLGADSGSCTLFGLPHVAPRTYKLRLYSKLLLPHMDFNLPPTTSLSLSLSQAEGKDGAGGTQGAEPVEPALVPTVLIPAPEPVLEAAFHGTGWTLSDSFMMWRWAHWLGPGWFEHGWSTKSPAANGNIKLHTHQYAEAPPQHFPQLSLVPFSRHLRRLRRLTSPWCVPGSTPLQWAALRPWWSLKPWRISCRKQMKNCTLAEQGEIYRAFTRFPMGVPPGHRFQYSVMTQKKGWFKGRFLFLESPVCKSDICNGEYLIDSTG